jgi:uncharacterized protein
LDRAPVVSSNVASVGYEVTTNILEVEFTNGSVYQYFDVPENVYQQLMQAASAGQYLNANIKGIYRYARV